MAPDITSVTQLLQEGKVSLLDNILLIFLNLLLHSLASHLFFFYSFHNHLLMYLCVYMYVCTYVYMYVCICLCIYPSICLSVYLSIILYLSIYLTSSSIDMGGCWALYHSVRRRSLLNNFKLNTHQTIFIAKTIIPKGNNVSDIFSNESLCSNLISIIYIITYNNYIHVWVCIYTTSIL